MRTLITVLFLAATATACRPLHGQVPSTAVRATRAATPPRVDGLDDDPVWSLADRRADFRAFAPSEDGEPRFRTEFRAAFDDRALYIFVRSFDPKPDSIVRLLSRRDTDGAPNDQIQLFIDSFNDRRSGYEYIVNAAGVKSDYILFDDTGFDQSWDGIWDVATQVDSSGWTAEYAIPLQQLRFSHREAPEFGIMVWRLVGRTGERVSWPSFRPSRSGYMSQTGTLAGLEGLVRPVSFDAAPYARYRTRNAGPAARARSDAALGGELTLLPTPAVSLDATINPDCGQVESDPAVLDLSGFEVFQAERRPFFLEGTGQFSFPLANDGISSLFHSRRIGRRPSHVSGAVDAPTETMIHAASKLTARVSSTSVALLSAVTAEERGTHPSAGRIILEPRAHYAVARVQREFRDGRSGVGVMATRVDRGAGDSMSAAVVPGMAQSMAITTQHQSRDGNYRIAGWLAGSNVRGTTAYVSALQLSNVHGFQRPDDDVAFDSTRHELTGAAGHLFLGKVAGGLLRWDAAYRWISPGFDVNEMGFLTIAGVRNLGANAGVRATRSGRVFGVPYRTASLMAGTNSEWTSSGLPTARGVTVTGSMQLSNLALLQASVAQQLPGGFCAMSCTRGGPALRDSPRTSSTFDATGDPRRKVIPHVGVQFFRDDEGRSHGGGSTFDLTWRARTNLDVSAALTAEQATLDAFFYRRIGSVLSDSARIVMARLEQPVRTVTARMNYTMTTTLSVQWYVQAYVSRGTYSNLREVSNPRADRYDDRFRPVRDTALTNHPLGVDFRQFRSNAVLRWEYRPGSTLFVVWTQGRDLASAEPGRLRTAHDLRELLDRPPNNVIALKASYWLSR